jgi:hypothetical protein
MILNRFCRVPPPFVVRVLHCLIVEANIIGPTNVWLICIIIKHVILPLV